MCCVSNKIKIARVKRSGTPVLPFYLQNTIEYKSTIRQLTEM